MAALFRRLKPWCLGAAVALLGVAMPAASQSGGISGTVTGWSMGSGGNATATINMVRGADGVWTQATYGLNASTLGAFAKSAVRRASGAYAAYELVKLAVEGVGWAIDELQHQVMNGKPSPKENIEPGAEYLTYTYGGVTYGSRTTTGICGVIRKLNPTYDQCTPQPRNGNFQVMKVTAGGGSVTTLWKVSEVFVPDDGTGNTPTEVSDNDLGNLMKANAAAAQAVMTDQYGRPYDHAELRAAVNAALSAFAAANGGTYTAPVLPPPRVPAPGTSPDSAPNTPPPPQKIEVQFPNFCEWASVVCDFINWYKEEPVMEKPDVPEEELSIPESGWSSGLASDAACPQPVGVTIEYLGHAQPIEFSYQPICTVLQLLRPVIIAIGALLAALVLAGRRTDSA